METPAVSGLSCRLISGGRRPVAAGVFFPFFPVIQSQRD